MFMCQRDSHLKEYETKVISCEEISDTKATFTEIGVSVPTFRHKLYKVILENTILFPEGGGQPDDNGLIDNFFVSRVLRDGTKAIHYVVISLEDENNSQINGNGLFQPGQSVKIKLDWERRKDHMQQHSGQHLITAIADQLFKFPTTSWWLGKEESFIELDTKEITDEQMRIIEETVNEKIRENIQLTVDVVELDDEKLKTARGRNLPADVTGNIRIVTMGQIESNVCCGTHVSSLSQLQAIKLLYCVKKKGKTQLFFLAGDRVLNRFSEMMIRETKLMSIFKTNPKELVVAADKLSASQKSYRKNLITLCKELATIEVARFVREKDSTGILWHIHRENIETDFATQFLKEVPSSAADKIILISLKTEGNQGQFWIQGGKNVTNCEDLVKKIGEQLSEQLDGKGNGRGLSFQAKVAKIDKISKVISSLECLLPNNNP